MVLANEFLYDCIHYIIRHSAAHMSQKADLMVIDRELHLETNQQIIDFLPHVKREFESHFVEVCIHHKIVHLDGFTFAGQSLIEQYKVVTSKN